MSDRCPAPDKEFLIRGGSDWNQAFLARNPAGRVESASPFDARPLLASESSRPQAMYIPPFAAKICPVVYPEIFGQTIPTTVAASSSGSATLPSSVDRRIASIP